MGEVTNIEWCDATMNAWEGCTKVSPGCDNCYAEQRNKRFHGGSHWGVGATRLVRSDSYRQGPENWNRDHDAFFSLHGRRRRVFCSSLADVFDNEAPGGQRERLWNLIRKTPNLDWLLLTKRVGNVKGMLPDDWGECWSNVWLGATIVNQDEADRDIIKLLNIPAHIRFLSMEPLLGEVDLTKEYLAARMGGEYPFKAVPREYRTSLLDRLDWVIVGGESGPSARPFVLEHAKTIVQDCKSAGVPVFVKQLGARPTNGEGVAHAITDKKGKRMDEWPEELRVREFPNTGDGKER